MSGFVELILASLDDVDDDDDGGLPSKKREENEDETWECVIFTG